MCLMLLYESRCSAVEAEDRIEQAVNGMFTARTKMAVSTIYTPFNMVDGTGMPSCKQPSDPNVQTIEGWFPGVFQHTGWTSGFVKGLVNIPMEVMMSNLLEPESQSGYWY